MLGGCVPKDHPAWVTDRACETKPLRYNRVRELCKTGRSGMDSRKRVFVAVVGYAAFVASATQVFVSQGYQQLATETISSRIVENTAFFRVYFLVAAALLPRGIKRVPLGLALIAAGTIVVSQGVFYLHNHGILTIPFGIMTGLHVGTGASFAVLFAFWAGVAYLFDRRSFQFCILAGSLMASFAVIFISAFQSAEAVLVTKCLFLVLSAGFSVKLAMPAKNSSGEKERDNVRLLSGIKGLFVPIICAGALGFAYQYSWTVAGLDALASMFFAIGEAFAVSVVLLAASMPGVRSFSVAWVFRLLCPIAFLQIVLQAFVAGVLQVLCMGIVSAAFNLCLILLMPLCASIAKRKGFSASGLYAAAAGVVNIFPTLGYVVGLLPRDYTGVGMYVLVFAVFAVLLVAARLHDGSAYDSDIVLGSGQEGDDGGGAPSTLLSRDYFAALVSEEYGLTSREEEVLRMVLLGRDAPSISEELCISANTVKTHIKRIYRKVDIHSRQELADMVEDFENSAHQGLLG